jgi:hypothetical protein
MLTHEEQSGRFLRRPQQAYPAATVADSCTAVLNHHVVHKPWRHLEVPGRLSMPMPLQRKGDYLTA